MATEEQLFSMPWPETTPQVGDGRKYTDGEWRQFWRTLVLSAKPLDGGVFSVPDDAELGRLEVTSPSANEIQVDSGAACVDGLFVPNDAPVTLSPASAGAGSTRQDRVVLRATWGESDSQYLTVVAIKEGTQAGPPELIHIHDSTWEISLARYTIDDVGAISSLVDERKATRFADGGSVPIGGIIMWSGAIEEIPWNWALCDGADGTPDLRDTFVMGAGNVAPGATGGANAVNLQHAHDQAATGSAGSHSHSQSETGYESSHTHTQGSTGSSGSHSHTQDDTSGAGSHAHTQGSTGSAGSHTHTQNATGGAGGHTHYVSSTTDTKGAHAHSWPSSNYTVPYDPVAGAPVDLGAEHDVASVVHHHVIPASAKATTSSGSHYHDYSFTTPNPGNHTHANPNTNGAGSHAHSNPNTSTTGTHSHSNPNTNSAGSHTHTNPTTSAGSSHRHTNPNTSTAPNHTHTNPTTANALSTSQDNRPAFYALAYIMRMH